MPPIEVQLLPPAASGDATLMGRITDLTNELVRFAEGKCRADGLGTMQLELRVPRDWSHPSKEFLARRISPPGATA